jgi:hypothetical protein
MAQGEAFFASSDYKSAVRLFSAANALAPDRPGPLLWLGLAHAAADQCVEALPALEEYLKKKQGDAKPEALRALAACKIAVKTSAPKPRTLSVRIASEPAGAEVHLNDGPAQGKTPLTMELSGEGSQALRLVLPNREVPALKKPLSGIAVLVLPFTFKLSGQFCPEEDNICYGRDGLYTMDVDGRVTNKEAKRLQALGSLHLNRLKQQIRALGGTVALNGGDPHLLEIASGVECGSNEDSTLTVRVDGWIKGAKRELASYRVPGIKDDACGHYYDARQAQSSAEKLMQESLAGEPAKAIVQSLSGK